MKQSPAKCIRRIESLRSDNTRYTIVDSYRKKLVKNGFYLSGRYDDPNSVTSMRWSAGMSRNTWVVPLVGQWISNRATRADLARPIVCSSGLPPKLLPEETWRWIVERLLAGGDHLDPRADRRAIGLLADELHRQPVVALAGVLEQDVVVLVAVDGTPRSRRTGRRRRRGPSRRRRRRAPSEGGRCRRTR